MENSEKKMKKKFSFESPEDQSNYFLTLKNLFKSGFITNCHLDDASVTEEELETLEELDYTEILENLKDLLENLLNFKRNIKENKSEDLSFKCEKLEKLLQIQEAEVRKHISTEHQLKLLIDGIQEKNEDLEKKYETAQLVIKTLENANPESVQKKNSNIEKNFQLQITELNQKYNSDLRTLKKESEKLQKLESIFQKKEQNYAKLQEDFFQMRSLLEKTTTECQALRKEIEKHSINIPKQSNKRYKDLQGITTSKLSTNKSCVAEDSRKSPPIKKNSFEVLVNNKKHSEQQLVSEHRQISSRHFLYRAKHHERSHSDGSTLTSLKKIIIKH